MSTGSVFNSVDWIAIILFFVGMLAIVWASMRKKVKDGEGYFLSARDEKWIPIGTSIYTSNIGVKEKERYTAYGATPEEKTATRASWNKWDVIHSAIVVGIVVVFYWSFW